MARVDLEAVLGANPTAEAAERLLGNLDHNPTPPADQMVVRVVGEVVHGRTVAEVDVVDDTEPFEVLQEPVHRGLVDVGLAGLDGDGQLLRRGMPVVVDEGQEDRPPGAGYPAAAGSKHA